MTYTTHPVGFEAQLHRSLIEPVMLGGAPRSLAIVNGTLAAALGLGLQQWVAGFAIWILGHSIAVVASRHDPDFARVLARHLRQRAFWSC